jgi:hypothetical protein
VERDVFRCVISDRYPHGEWYIEHRRISERQNRSRYSSVANRTITSTSNITTGTISASNVTASGRPKHSGYANVRTTIDGNKIFTSTSDISVRNVTSPGTITPASGKCTINDILAIDGYANVRTAIDSKQANLTNISDISVRNVTAAGVLNIPSNVRTELTTLGANKTPTLPTSACGT